MILKGIFDSNERSITINKKHINAPAVGVEGIADDRDHQDGRHEDAAAHHPQRQEEQQEHPEDSPARHTVAEEGADVLQAQRPLHLQFEHDARAAQQRARERGGHSQRAQHYELQHTETAGTHTGTGGRLDGFIHLFVEQTGYVLHALMTRCIKNNTECNSKLRS